MVVVVGSVLVDVLVVDCGIVVVGGGGGIVVGGGYIGVLGRMSRR